MSILIPTCRMISMANDKDVYEVEAELMFARDLHEEGTVITNFNDWLNMSEWSHVNGYGKHSGQRLWQLPREIQRQAYRACKAKSFEVSDQ